MFKNFTWKLILVLAVAGFITLSAGFIKAMEVTNISDVVSVAKTQEVKSNVAKAAVPLEDTNSMKIIVMGDSIAHGTGDEKGKGFTTYLPDYLKSQTSKELSLENIGIDGQKIDGLLDQLQNVNLKNELKASNIVVISIGGNDLRGLRVESDTSKMQEFKPLEASYLKSLKEILETIRKSSVQTYIVFVGLYNPYDNLASLEDTKLITMWNYDTQQLIEADGKAIFIPTYDIFKFNLNRLIAPDKLHPNSLGYQTISSRIAKSIENTFNKS